MRRSKVQFQKGMNLSNSLAEYGTQAQREQGRSLQGDVQLDDANWGGRRRCYMRGRGSRGETPFVAAVATNLESGRHLSRYLLEFTYRFNRRFDLAGMVESMGAAAALMPPMPCRFVKLAEARWQSRFALTE